MKFVNNRERTAFRIGMIIWIVLYLGLLGAFLAKADDWGFNFVCRTDEHDVYHLSTDGEVYWTLVPQAEYANQITTQRGGLYSFPHGGVYVWRGMDGLGLAPVGDNECAGEENAQPHQNPMNECLGFYAPVTEFTVDGNTYAAGSDGWVSFLVDREAVWTWTVTVDGWTGYYQQTETEACHYVGSDN